MHKMCGIFLAFGKTPLEDNEVPWGRHQRRHERRTVVMPLNGALSNRQRSPFGLRRGNHILLDHHPANCTKCHAFPDLVLEML